MRCQADPIDDLQQRTEQSSAIESDIRIDDATSTARSLSNRADQPPFFELLAYLSNLHGRLRDRQRLFTGGFRWALRESYEHARVSFHGFTKSVWLLLP
jgi:hypothetical protein